MHTSEAGERGHGMPSSDFVRQLEGYGLTTAHILYWNPDYPDVLSPPLTWQAYDVWPQFPRLHKFVRFWKTEIDGRLHSITVAHARLIKPAEIRMVEKSLKLH